MKFDRLARDVLALDLRRGRPEMPPGEAIKLAETFLRSLAVSGLEVSVVPDSHPELAHVEWLWWMEQEGRLEPAILREDHQ